MTIEYDDDDARPYNNDPQEDREIDYGDICPRCYELWRDCVCERDYRDDTDYPESWTNEG